MGYNARIYIGDVEVVLLFHFNNTSSVSCFVEHVYMIAVAFSELNAARLLESFEFFSAVVMSANGTGEAVSDVDGDVDRETESTPLSSWRPICRSISVRFADWSCFTNTRT